MTREASSVIDYTLVVGVDAAHLKQLALTWPTWKRFKPSLLDRPMLAFFDREQIADSDEVREVVDHPDLLVVPWPPPFVEYKGGDSKWTNKQRRKMLSGFVHVPARLVASNYWLKLDTDVVATGCDDWIDESWFNDDPVIVGHRWGYTKPADQMMQLDQWAECSQAPWLRDYPPLNLAPKPGASSLGHKRIISWCCFFENKLTLRASAAASSRCGRGQLPVPSQDGYLWYFATRMKQMVRRVNMKSRGWKHCSSTSAIERSIQEIE